MAEGLPGRFVFDKIGPNQATVDIHPQKALRARSRPEAICDEPEGAIDVDSGSDSSSDATEAQDRIISGVAMSVAAVTSPDVSAVVGPGANPGPLRLLPLVGRSTCGGNTGSSNGGKG